MPTAVNDTNSVTEGNTVTGDVLGNDDSGADGWTGGGNAVVGVVAGDNGGTPTSGGTGTVIVGAHGRLTLNPDGSYTYVANPGITVPNPVDVFTYTVRDADDNVIYTEAVSAKAAGTTYDFNWSGKDSSGAVASDGVYTVNLALLNAKGEAVIADQVVDAKVTGVVNNEGVVYLGLDGGQLMELSKVRQVTEAKTTSTNTSGSGTTAS